MVSLGLLAKLLNDMRITPLKLRALMTEICVPIYVNVNQRKHFSQVYFTGFEFAQNFSTLGPITSPHFYCPNYFMAAFFPLHPQLFCQQGTHVKRQLFPQQLFLHCTLYSQPNVLYSRIILHHNPRPKTPTVCILQITKMYYSPHKTELFPLYFLMLGRNSKHKSPQFFI